MQRGVAEPAFLGYIPEGFRVYRGVVAKAHSGFMKKIQIEP